MSELRRKRSVCLKVLWHELYEAFKRVNGYAMSAVGVCVAVVLFLVLPGSKISIGILVPVTIPVILLLITIFDCALSCTRRMATRLPEVIHAYQPSAPYSDALATLLLNESSIFAHGAMVSIFTRANDFERLIGLGFVSTIQENGLIQVCVLDGTKIDTVTEEIWHRILQNNKDELQLLLVKPSIPQSYYLR